MATTPVEFRAPTGLTLTLELYAYGSDTIGNTGGDSATEATNRKGLYSASVTEALAGWYTAHVKSGSTVIAVYDVFMVDDTNVHRCTDRPQDQAQETVASVTGAVGSVTGAVGSVTGNVGGIAGTITTLDALDTAQDTQHSTTQSAISALNDPTAAEIADAVWLETLADHSGTAGSTAEALNAAGAAGDPWTTALPGAYGAGSAGNIIGNLNDPTAAAIADAVLDEAMAGHVTAGSLGKYIADILEDTGTTIPGTLTTVEGKIDTIDGIVDAIVLDTAELQTDWTNGGRLDLLVDAILEDTGTTLPATLTTIEGKVDAVDTVVDTILIDTAELQTDWTNGGRLDLLLDAVLLDTGTTLPAQITGLNNISAADVNAQVLDVINTDTLVAGQTLAEAVRRIGAITSGTISGAGTGTETFVDWAGSGSTIVVTVDASGNRSGVTYN